MADRFSLTDDQMRQIRQWQKEKETLERQLQAVTEKLNAIAVLGGTPARIERPQKRPTRKANGKGAPNLTAAIERIITTSSAPLTKKQIKEKLVAEHFPEERLGAYFYTCIMRLKAKQRIKVLEDGRVEDGRAWKS